MNIYTHTLAKLIAGLCAHGQTGARALPAAPGCPEPARGHIPGTKQGKGLFQAGAAALVGAAPAEILPFPLYLSFLHFLTPKQQSPGRLVSVQLGAVPVGPWLVAAASPPMAFAAPSQGSGFSCAHPGSGPVLGALAPCWGLLPTGPPLRSPPHPPANPGALLHLLAWWHLQDVT